jgi:plastocyanin
MAVLTALVALACTSGGSPAKAETAHVSIANTAFSPDSVRVQLGPPEPAFAEFHAHVQFVNNDTAQHTVTFADPRVQSSGTLGTGQLFDAVFLVTGTFAYSCSIHPSMRGTVVVTEFPATTTTTAATTTTTQPPAMGAPTTSPPSTAPSTTAPASSRTTVPRATTAPTVVPTVATSTVPMTAAPSTEPASTALSTTTVPTTEATGDTALAAQDEDGGSGGGGALIAALGVMAAGALAVPWLWRRRARGPTPPGRLDDQPPEAQDG